MSADERLPAGIVIAAKLRELDHQAVSYYIANKGAYFSGTLLLKLNRLDGFCRVLIQNRDETGKLIWMDALKDEYVAEEAADAYIRRAVARDPDLWAIEIETRDGKNFFEE